MSDIISRLIRASADIASGINSFRSQFSSKWVLEDTSFNLTTGIDNGIGPRYGFAPIPGHADNEDPNGTPICGQVEAEGSSTNAFENRVKTFGIVPILHRQNDFSVPEKKVYIWLLVADDGTNRTLFFQECVNPFSSAWRFTHDIADGIAGQDSTTAYYRNFLLGKNLSNSIAPGAGLAVFRDYFSIPSTTNYVRYATASRSGNDEPLPYLLAVTLGASTATECATWYTNNSGSGYTGNVTSVELGNFPRDRRTIRAYELKAPSSYTGFVQGYLYENVDFNKDMYTGAPLGVNTTRIDYTDFPAPTVITRLNGGSPEYGTDGYILWNDNKLTINNSYTAILVAAGAAKVALYQEGQVDQNNYLGKQLVNMHSLAYEPQQNKTDYTETDSTGDTINPIHCMWDWPAFVEGTALADNSAGVNTGTDHVTLGKAGSGVLRSNTVYEITYSIYNKALGYESNVGLPVKIQTGSKDNVALSIFRDTQNMGAWNQTNMATETISGVTDNDNTVPIYRPQNHVQYRFYYRALGSYEWIPALFIDAAKLFHYPDHKVLWICEGTVPGTVGGQPGGFNDYSALPEDNYIDVQVYKNRAFWFTKNAIRYSLANNFFSYPLRNQVPVQSGELRGALVHNYPGQAEQNSRLIVFGDKEIFVGRFTGQRTQQSVQVDPNTLATFEVEGSDFVLDPWTSNTAFSARSAVVADGILYYWGQKGIFRDDGVQTPVNISYEIEPDLFGYYDPAKTKEIFAHYNSKTKQIMWIYDPAENPDSISYGLIYSLETQDFYPVRFEQKIDWMQDLEISDDDSDEETAGERVIAGVRADNEQDIQRAYFFDERCRAGDLKPGAELMVKEFSTPVAGQRRFTFATGFDLSGINVNDIVTLDQIQKYSKLGTVENIYGVVAAKGAGYLDVTIPSSATFAASGTLTYKNYFPVYVDTVHGFDYQIESRYWCPWGFDFWAYFLHVYSQFKVDLLPTDTAPTVDLDYKTALASAYETTRLTLTDNADGNFINLASLQFGGQNIEGQGIKFEISGTHIGHKWVLQYFQVMADQLSRDGLMTFNDNFEDA